MRRDDQAARAQGRPVTSEVNPWTLWLGNDWANVERLGSYALSYYVERHHYEAVWKGLMDGTLDMIATDTRLTPGKRKSRVGPTAGRRIPAHLRRRSMCRC